jgi:Nucleotidyl transferase AbiEii toxin, Type IV TA system
MTKQEFFHAVTNGGDHVLAVILDLLKKSRAKYCVIGGLAVNAYVEPVVSLDLDIIIVADALEPLLKSAASKFRIERFSHSINLRVRRSDLRIQIQTDPRYQDFIPRASRKKVLGIAMKVAAIEDVVQGKLWAYSDKRRRPSKRQKDLADLYRLVEAYPRLKRLLPGSLKKTLK